MAKATHILYDPCPDGYTVRVMSGGNTLDEYNSGNAPFDSTTVIDRNDPDALSYGRLLKYAERTAKEMSVERGNISIERDADLLAPERTIASDTAI